MGEKNVSFLKKRFKALSSVSLFQGMEFSDDPEKLIFNLDVFAF
jgi:malate dehydrogenase (quinone)